MVLFSCSLDGFLKMNFKHLVCIASSLPIALNIPIANANQQTLSYPNGEACSQYSSTLFCKELTRLLNDFQTARTCQTSILSQIFSPPKDLNPKTCYSGTIAEYVQLLNRNYPNTALLPLYFPQGAMPWSKTNQIEISRQYRKNFDIIVEGDSDSGYKESSKAIFFVRDFCSDESFLNEITNVLFKNKILRPISNIFLDSCKSTSALSVLTMRSKL